MAVMLYMKMPGLSVEMLKAVNAELDIPNDPVAGFIFHAVADIGGTLTVIDVWESRADFDKFNEARLGPAFATVAAAQGIDMSALPEPAQEWVDVLDIATP